MNPIVLPRTLSPGIVPLFAIVLTLGAYLFGVEVQKRLRKKQTGRRLHDQRTVPQPASHLLSAV